eukprot:3272611-Amphidinium_carterae.1
MKTEVRNEAGARTHARTWDGLAGYDAGEASRSSSRGQVFKGFCLIVLFASTHIVTTFIPQK